MFFKKNCILFDEFNMLLFDEVVDDEHLENVTQPLELDVDDDEVERDL